jgi:hypothetical protein
MGERVRRSGLAWMTVWMTVCLLGGMAIGMSAQETAKSTAQAPGSVQGKVTDTEGDPVSGATVTLTVGTPPETLTGTTAGDGVFRFERVPAGIFSVKVVEDGMDEAAASGTLRPGEMTTLAALQMRVKNVETEVDVMPSEQIAALQVQEEEKQRLFGAIPNFYVVYDHDAAPMTTKLKYQMAWRNLIDPFNLGLVAANAGIEQADGAFSGFGPGPAGYGKRVGAGMGDFLIGSYLTGAVLPQVFKQDPRYFYKGTGSNWSRVKYAVAMAVVCRGDNGKWQPCYSNVLGAFGAAGASNLYYPRSDRRGASLTLELGLISIGSDAAGNVIQEFLLKHLTSKKHNHGATIPGN